jgi:hypothetical protein
MICIKQRLLRICEQSYYSPLPTADRFGETGWNPAAGPLQNPVLIRREPDVALVGRVGNSIVLAFRGTRPPFDPKDKAIWATFLDWMNDADCAPDAGILYPGGHRPFAYPGIVHHGFARSVGRLWGGEGGSPGVASAVETLIAQGAGPDLLVTGHSKGGPLANLAAWRAAEQWPNLRARVFTLAGARPGDSAFKAAYEGHPRIQSTRYEVRYDVVPYLPFGDDAWPLLRALLADLPLNNYKGSGYCAVGRQVCAGAGLGETILKHLRGLFGFLLGKSKFEALLPVFVAAHLIAPGSAYDALIRADEPGCTHV